MNRLSIVSEQRSLSHHSHTELMLRTVGLSLLYAAAVEFPLALCFWQVGIPTARPGAAALLLAFSQLPGILVFDSLGMDSGYATMSATADALRPSLEQAGALALVNTVVLALLVFTGMRTAAALAAGEPAVSPAAAEGPAGEMAA